jgi:hypothetical protein
LHRCFDFLTLFFVSPATKVAVDVRPKNRQGPWTVELQITSDDDLVDIVAFFYEADDEGPRLVGGSLERSEPIYPTDLGRFGWSQWATVAGEALRRQIAGRAHIPARETDLIHRAASKALGVRSAKGRPGPKPRDPSFFAGIARRYSELLAQGELAPTKRLADEMDYERSTMAGFVRKARKLGYLGAARRGRAG